MKLIFRTILSGLIVGIAVAQNPQTQNSPISAINSKYTNGVAPGYWPTAGAGLVLNISSGSSVCSQTAFHYTGGTLTLTASSTNYVFLDSTSNCVPAFNTSGFPTTGIPLATVVTSASAITSVDDLRSPFNYVSAGFINPMTTLGDIITGGISGAATRLAGNTSTTRKVLLSQGDGTNSASPFYGQLTQDDILPGFAINSFSCAKCGTYETGATVASPSTFTIAYSSTPTSASISDGTHSVALTSPFTSGSLPYSYTTNTTFTLTAISSSTKTATGSIAFAPRQFGGVGTTGATGATASGTTAILTGATGTLNSLGLNTTGSGFTVNVSPSGQAIYFLLTGSTHTFTFNTFVTAFTSTPITFINVNGTSVPNEYLYISPATYTGSYTVVVN